MDPPKLLEAGTRRLRFAARAFWRHKRSHFAVSAPLALGIGLSVAMFSLVDSVLLRPLPFPGQESIYLIWKSNPLAGSHVEELAYPELIDLRDGLPGIEYAAVLPTSLCGHARVLQTGTADPVQLEASPVSHDFFRVLGVTPRLGRDFTGSDERAGAPPVVVLADRTWRGHFGANPGIVGQTVRLNGQGHTVMGVMGPGVEFPRDTALWVPLGIDQRVVERRGATFLQAIVRAEPRYPLNRISSDVNALFKRLAAEHPDAYSSSQQGVVTPLVNYWTGSARIHLWIVLGAAVLLLTASAISSGGFLLSRATSRQAEIATHLALGARRRQILAEMAAEGVVIAGVAATAGLGIAHRVLGSLVRWGHTDIPRLSESALNLDSFLWAGGAAAFVAIVCSLAPGSTVSESGLESALSEGGVRTSAPGRAKLTRSLFVLAQLALTAALLAAAVLLVLSYRAVAFADTGFANHDALTMDASLRGPGLFPSQGFDSKTKQDFTSRLMSRLRDEPGVTSAAAILLRPLAGPIGWDIPYRFEFEAGVEAGKARPKANYEVVTDDYFETVGTPLLAGRDFDSRDAAEAEPVAIINENLARRVRSAGHDPLGHRVRLRIGGTSRWMRVIAICKNARYRSGSRTGFDIFVPHRQASQQARHVVVRGTRSGAELGALVRQTVSEIDPSQTAGDPMTIGALIGRDAARHRFNMALLLCFAGCAVILAVSAVHSVIAETIMTRRAEIAIKTALGAQRHRIVLNLVSHTLAFACLGLVLGTSAVAVFGTMGPDVLHGTSARDPAVLGPVATFLLLVSAVAASWPAWNSTGQDPSASFRAI